MSMPNFVASTMSLRALAEDLAEEALRAAALAIDVGGVEERDAEVERLVPVSTWTRQGCMLVPLGARAATSRMRSINSRGTGVGRKARTEQRVAIAASTTAAASESVTRHALLL